jgi:hypothetical protein
MYSTRTTTSKTPSKNSPLKKTTTGGKPKKVAKGRKVANGKKIGGGLIEDMSKLAVPFGLIAAKNSLELFIMNQKNKQLGKKYITISNDKKISSKKVSVKKPSVKKPSAKKTAKK